MARGPRGPAPKLPGERRRYNQPAVGEWVDLRPLEQTVLPPANRKWGVNAKRAWAVWRRDPVTTQWGPADVWFAQELARLFDELPPVEWRMRCETLGLSPKGKRDLRWRTPQEVKTISEQPPVVKRLRLTEKDEPAA